MARTYRRKQKTHEYCWLLTDWRRGPGRVRVDPASPEGRRRLARFHSDAQRTLRMAPAWYRRVDEHQKRHREDMACRTIPQHGGGEALAIRRRPTVRWTWN